jgi:putative pyridoxal-dependent aspartate 1-decarboxylase
MNMQRGARKTRRSIRNDVLGLFSLSPAAMETHRATAISCLYELHQNSRVCADSSLEALGDEIATASNGLHTSSSSNYFKFLKETIIPESTNMSSPRCIGHMTSVVPGFLWALGELMIGLNQNVVKRDASRAITILERQALAILHKFVYGLSEDFYRAHAQNEADTLGILTSGSSISNITALWMARNICFGRADEWAGVQVEGLAGANGDLRQQRAVIISSTFAHYSIQKAAGILGIGERNVIDVPVDRRGRMDLRRLQRVIEECSRRGDRILAIVATAGTTDSGSIDPVGEIADLAHSAGVHLHVDAAWGSPLLFSKRFRHKLAGIERADSVTIDGHKQLYLPLGISILLLRDPSAGGAIEKQSRYMLQEFSGDLGKRSLEGSRPGSALLLHAALQVIGCDGYAFLVEDNIRKARAMSSKLTAMDAFELLIPPETNIVLYRYIVPRLRDAVRSGRLTTADNKYLNLVNENIQKAQAEAGHAFVSRTTISGIDHGSPVVALRAVLANPFTTEQDIEFVLRDQMQRAESLIDGARAQSQEA